MFPVETNICSQFSMTMVAWRSTESVAPWNMTSSIIDRFSSQLGRKSINLLLWKILKHFPPQWWIFNRCNNRSNIHGVRLSGRGLRWLGSSLSWSELIILNQLTQHITWQVLYELSIHSHSNGLSYIGIKNFNLLLWLLCWLGLCSLVCNWLVWYS